MTKPQVRTNRLIDSRHPTYTDTLSDWDKWRLCYVGGDDFKRRYLERFGNREDREEFRVREALTPVPTHAKSAITEIRNSIFQRMTDITRTGGSADYHKAISGEVLGVDRRGSTMNQFLGQRVLDELLLMGRVGVYVDNSVITGSGTIADATNARPYLYHYPIEDILSWAYSGPDHPSEFQSVLLRDKVLEYDHATRLPIQQTQRYRLLWIDDATQKVMLQFLNGDGEEVDRDGNPAGPVKLELSRIPFVMVDIGASLMKDVADHQISLLNLCSTDVWYALKSNFTLFTQQRDGRTAGSHIKTSVAANGSSEAGGQGADDSEREVGPTNGIFYDMKAERPGYVHPSPEPLMASMSLQDRLEQSIRKLVHLSVTNVVKQQSAESKGHDKEGLEAGLSQIGLMLEGAERQIAEHWASYENRIPSSRKIATVKYPDSYSLKTDLDRIEEGEKLSKLGFAVPSRTAKKEISKQVVQVLFSGRLNVGTIDLIHKEIEDAEYTTSDPDIIIDAKDAGLVGERVASMALGFPEGEHENAQKDHVARVKRLAEAQGEVEEGDGDDPPAGARGVPDLDDDPAQSGKREKELSRNTDKQTTTKKRVRGKGRDKKEES